jgi:hypothetical protein
LQLRISRKAGIASLMIPWRIISERIGTKIESLFQFLNTKTRLSFTKNT